MSSLFACPQCGGQEIRRTHRKNNWERLLSAVGFFPYSCRTCRNRFVRFRSGGAYLALLVTVWLLSAAMLGGAAWWLLLETSTPVAPPMPPSPVRAVAAKSAPDANQLNQLSSRNQELRQALTELRSSLTAMSREKASLQKELASLAQQLAAMSRPQPTPPPPPVQASPAPAPARKVLLAAIPFGPGSTQPGPKAARLLGKVAQELRAQPHLTVVVEGNADATPLGRASAKLYYDNTGVAMARALSVFRALREAGVEPGRMQVTASGAPSQEDAGRTVSIWLVKKPT